MHRARQLATRYPLPVYLFVSSVYWPDEQARGELIDDVSAAIGRGSDRYEVSVIETASEIPVSLAADKEPVAVVALSGGVQPLMQEVGSRHASVAILNAYLPGVLPGDLSGRLMHANAHPASTDFFASCRIDGKDVRWLSSLAELDDYATAWEGFRRLSRARLLKIGETEPWVINSCRDPKVIADRVGCEVIPLQREELYSVYRDVTDADAAEDASVWLDRSQKLTEVQQADILKACRVTVAMRRKLEEYEADGLSMACFAMIGDIDTTSCLSLSALNDSAYSIGACEGDLDAAVTLFLLKSMGADFVWISNPIIHEGDYVDLVHCTAPTCGCGLALQYSLMRHHESGRGVSPEVELPSGQVASAVRMSVNEKTIVCHVGTTEKRAKLPACNTQIRLHVESRDKVLETLLGTHLVLSYGDFGRRVDYASGFLGFESRLTQK